MLDKELKQLTTEIPPHIKIQTLSLIHIDDLINFREPFKTELIPLKKAISGYTSKLNDKTSPLNPIQTFDNFLKRKYGAIS